MSEDMDKFWDEVEGNLNAKYGARRWHCDDILDDKSAPPCVLDFLKVARSLAHGTPLATPELYANYDGVRVQVTMASRFGDVGIRFYPFEPRGYGYGYDKRVFLPDLTDFGAKS
jgi:hypothetical protein